MEVPQKLVPNPINKSFIKNPIKTLKIDNNKSGNDIRQEPSCAFVNVILLPLESAKNTKNKSLVE